MKAGCKSTSVNRSSAFASCLVRVERNRPLVSWPPFAFKDAPISESSPASLSASRVVVPSSQKRCCQLGQSLLAGGHKVITAAGNQPQAEDRKLVPLGDQHLEPVREFAADDRWRRERGVRANHRHFAAIERVLDRDSRGSVGGLLTRAINDRLRGPSE